MSDRFTVGLDRGLGGGCTEFSGMSFLSNFDTDPDEGCKYDVGRFFNACLWYIFPGDAAIMDAQL